MEVSVLGSCDLEKKKRRLCLCSRQRSGHNNQKKGEEFMASGCFGTESEKVLAVRPFFFLSMIHLHIEFP